MTQHETELPGWPWANNIYLRVSYSNLKFQARETAQHLRETNILPKAQSSSQSPVKKLTCSNSRGFESLSRPSWVLNAHGAHTDRRHTLIHVHFQINRKKIKEMLSPTDNPSASFEIAWLGAGPLPRSVKIPWASRSKVTVVTTSPVSGLISNNPKAGPGMIWNWSLALTPSGRKK